MFQNVYTISFIILLFAVLSDLLVPFILGNKYPGYSHLLHTISTLGTDVSPVKKYECANLAVVGILFIIFSLAQYFTIKTKNWAFNWYLISIGVYGAGCILAGLFPEDEKGQGETVNGKIHGIASGIGFLFLIAAPIFAVWIKALFSIVILNIAFFALGLLSFIVFLISEGRERGILRYSGLLQRINLCVLYLSLIVNFLGLRFYT